MPKKCFGVREGGGKCGQVSLVAENPRNENNNLGTSKCLVNQGPWVK